MIKRIVIVWTWSQLLIKPNLALYYRLIANTIKVALLWTWLMEVVLSVGIIFSIDNESPGATYFPAAFVTTFAEYLDKEA